MDKKTTKQMAGVLILVLAFGLCQPASPVLAVTLKLSKKSISVEVGKSTTIRVRGTKKKAKWTVKSGKKYIELKAKKKTSVKVYGVQRGIAKVQCKVGKKKLICKVVVKEGKKPQITKQPAQSQVSALPTETAMSTADVAIPTPSLQPTSAPVTIPTATPKLLDPEFPPFQDLLQTPGPQADYDRLKVETGLHWLGNVRYAEGTVQRYHMHFFESDIRRNMIEKITISAHIEIPDTALGSIDVSEKGNESVMAWYVDEDDDGYYEMTIGQEGGVVANENSRYLFCDIGSRVDQEENAEIVYGLDNLYTSYVKDMSYMFADCGAGYMSILDFGETFDIGMVTQAEKMLVRAGDEEQFQCYTTSETMFQWLRNNAKICGFRVYLPEGISSEYDYSKLAGIILGEAKY